MTTTTQNRIPRAPTPGTFVPCEEIKDLAPRMPTSFLRNFFAEKDIPEVNFKFEDSQGTPHFMPNACVVEQIAACPIDAGLRGIEANLRQLDFYNLDINHFLAHLARGMAEARLRDQNEE